MRFGALSMSLKDKFQIGDVVKFNKDYAYIGCPIDSIATIIAIKDGTYILDRGYGQWSGVAFHKLEGVVEFIGYCDCDPNHLFEPDCLNCVLKRFP